MRIVHVRPKYLPLIGGTELNIDQLGRYMVERGHEFVVLTSTAGSSDVPYDIIRLTQKKEYFDYFQAKREASRFSKWLMGHSYDIIHLHTFSVRFHLFNLVFFPIFHIARLKNVRVVFTLHCPKEDYLQVSRQCYRKGWHDITLDMKKSNLVIFVEYSMLKYAMDLNIEHCTYIPTSIDTSLFIPDPRNTNLLKQLNLDSKFVILSVSRLDTDRNIVEIIKTAKILKGHSDITFLICGSGNRESYLRGLASKWDCKNVFFLGQVDNKLVRELLSVSDVLVNSIESPGLGRNVLEAMACGKPVIRRGVGEDYPLLQNGFNFLRYKSDDDLTEKILMLADDPKLGRKIGKRAVEFVRRHASTRVVGYRTEEVYKCLLVEK